MVLDAEARPQSAHYGSATAGALLFELVAAVDAGAGLDAYLAGRARPLLGGGAARAANVFALREQQVPASRLAQGLPLGIPEELQRSLWHMLDRGPAGTAAPDRPRPAAVYGAAYQLACGGDPGALAALGGPPPLEGLDVISSGAYSKTADYGRPDPAGGDAFRSAMIVFTHPTDLGYVRAFDDWYAHNHMIDVAKSPPYRSATRYVLERRLAGTPLPYLCIYEIEAPYGDRTHSGMMQQVGVDPWPQRLPMPVTDGGQGVLAIDFWGYFERAWRGP